MTLPANKAFEVDPKLVLEVASGLEDPAAIALRYGFDAAAWEKLSTWQPFINEITAKRIELEKSGYVFRMKSAMLAEDLLGDVYTRAKAHDVALTLKLDALKLLSKLGDLEPKAAPAGSVLAGQGFSITIQLPGAAPALPVYLKHKPVETFDVIDVEPSKETRRGDE